MQAQDDYGHTEGLSGFHREHWHSAELSARCQNPVAFRRKRGAQAASDCQSSGRESRRAAPCPPKSTERVEITMKLLTKEALILNTILLLNE